MGQRSGTWIAIYCPREEAVLMARRSEQMNNPYFWNFFGGQVDDGESPREAAVRELWEEANLKVGKKQIVRVAHLRLEGPGYSGIERDLYFFLVVAENPIKVRLDREHSEYRWFRQDNLPFSVTRVTQIILDKGLLKKAIARAANYAGKALV